MTNISIASKAVKPSQTPPKDARILSLESAVKDMDESATAGFNQIRAITRLLVLSFETPAGHNDNHIGTIVSALDAIAQLTDVYRDYSTCRADDVECQFYAPWEINRLEARRLAQIEKLGPTGQTSKGGQ